MTGTQAQHLEADVAFEQNYRRRVRRWNERASWTSVRAVDASDSKASLAELERQNKFLVAQIKDVLRKHVLKSEIYRKRSPNLIRLLEVGSGIGLVTSMLVAEGYEVHAVDFAYRMRMRAREMVRYALDRRGTKVFIRFYNSSADRLTRNSGGPFDREFFDVALWVRLGLHLTDDDEWSFGLGEAIDTLKVGGFLLVCESLQDDNEAYRFQPCKNAFTKIRTEADYDKALGAYATARGYTLHKLVSQLLVQGEENRRILLYQITH